MGIGHVSGNIGGKSERFPVEVPELDFGTGPRLVTGSFNGELEFAAVPRFTGRGDAGTAGFDAEVQSPSGDIGRIQFFGEAGGCDSLREGEHDAVLTDFRLHLPGGE